MRRMALLFVVLMLFLNMFVVFMPLVDAVDLKEYCYAQWHMNESSGNNVMDSSGNKRNGTRVNMEDSDWVAGKLNNCLLFDGSNEYINCSNIANFERTASVSYEFWFNSTLSAMEIFLSKYLQSAGRGLMLYMTAGKIYFDMRSGTSAYLSVSTNNTFNDGVWHHCIITYDGTYHPPGVTIYVDGVSQNKTTNKDALVGSVLNSESLFIARRSAGNYWQGKLDEVVIYKKVLNQGEVNSRYNGGVGTESIFGLPSSHDVYAGGATIQKVYVYWSYDMTKKNESSDYGGIIYALAQDDTYLYAGGFPVRKVYQYWKSNLTKRAETVDYGGQIRGIAEDATYIYFGGTTTNKVYQCWKSNLTKKAEVLYGGAIYCVVDDDTYVYAGGWTAQKIYQYWKTNMTKKAETASYGGSIYALAQDGTYLYVGGDSTMRVRRYWTTNMTYKDQSNSYGGSIQSIILDDNYIYAGGLTTNKIYQYWKSNLTKKAETTSYGGSIYALAQNATYVYAGGATTQKVYQFLKSNLTKRNESSGYGGILYSLLVSAVSLNPPSPFIATPVNRTHINVSWTKGNGAYTTYIMAKLGSYPINRSDGTNIYNGTGTSKQHTGLSPNQHWFYCAWSWNNTNNQWSSSYASADATTFSNYPPVFSGENPVNGSTGRPLSFTWQINISDPNGDLFNWTIQCNNGQSSSANGASNGTKSLALSGLTLSTTYKVYVNATDGFAWTRRWYTFTTRGNLPPIFGTPSPANGSTVYNLSLSWTISIQDPDGDLFNWSIQCNNSQTNSANGASNGTKSLNLSGLSYYRVYRIWVNATDGFAWTRAWYIFQVIPANRPPIIFNEYPFNNSVNDPLQLIWNCTIQDPDGDDFDWWINCSSGDRNWQDDTNGSKFVLIFYINYSHSYTIWVNATDGFNWTRHVYYIHTSGIPTLTTFYPIQIGIYWFLPVLLGIALLSPFVLLFLRRRRREQKI